MTTITVIAIAAACAATLLAAYLWLCVCQVKRERDTLQAELYVANARLNAHDERRRGTNCRCTAQVRRVEWVVGNHE